MASIISADTQIMPVQMSVREVFRIREFRFLSFAQLIADFGDSLTMVTLLLLLNKLTGSALSLATLVAVMAIPELTIGLVAGVYVDRLNRRNVMIVSDVVRGVLVLSLALLLPVGHIWIFYLVAALQASVGTFFNPARLALNAELIPPNGLMATNSVTQTGRVLVMALGGAAAGILLSAFSQFWPALVGNSVTFFMSAFLVSRISVKGSSPMRTKSASTVWRSLTEGFRTIAGTPVLIGSLLVVAICMLGISSVNVLMIPMLINILHMPPAWFGVLSFAQTLGMLIGGVLIAASVNRLAAKTVTVACAVALGVGLGFMGAVTSLPQLLPSLVLIGFAIVGMSIAVTTVLQTALPNELLGRVGAANGTLIGVANLLSVSIAGALGDAIGVKNFFVIAGGLACGAGVIAALLYRSKPPAVEQLP